MNAISLYNPIPIGYFIATHLLIIGGVPLNLRFCYRWQRVFSTKEEEKDISTHDEATTRDVSTIPVTKSMPSQEENVSGTVTA